MATIDDLVKRDHTMQIPSTLEMYQALGGQTMDLVELISQAQGPTDALVAVLGAGAIIGYYYAFEHILGAVVEFHDGGGKPC